MPDEPRSSADIRTRSSPPDSGSTPSPQRLGGLFCAPRSVCPITVETSLRKVPGVTDAKIDFDRKTATVRLDAGKANVATLVKATTEAGFPSTVRK